MYRYATNVQYTLYTGLCTRIIMLGKLLLTQVYYIIGKVQGDQAFTQSICMLLLLFTFTPKTKYDNTDIVSTTIMYNLVFWQIFIICKKTFSLQNRTIIRIKNVLYFSENIYDYEVGNILLCKYYYIEKQDLKSANRSISI